MHQGLVLSHTCLADLLQQRVYAELVGMGWRRARRARLVDGREADARAGGQLVREVLHHALQARGRLECRLAGVRVLPPTQKSGC